MSRDSIFSLKDGMLCRRGKVVKTAFPVAEAILFDDKVVVRLDVPTGTISNRNILAYSADGKVLWTIPESPDGGTRDNPYVQIEKDGSGKIIARNWNGVEYLVDSANGAITVCGFKRF